MDVRKWNNIAINVRPGPCLTTAIWRCRKPFSQWQPSFQRKLRSHWLKFLRQRHVAVVRQVPVPFRNMILYKGYARLNKASAACIYDFLCLSQIIPLYQIAVCICLHFACPVYPVCLPCVFCGYHERDTPLLTGIKSTIKMLCIINLHCPSHYVSSLVVKSRIHTTSFGCSF